jgi:hypothetical protein
MASPSGLADVPAVSFHLHRSRKVAMLRRTMIIGVVAAAVGVICVAVVLAQNDGDRRSPLAGWEVVQSAEFELEPISSAELVAECPEGKLPLGGGFSKHPSTPDSQPGFEVAASFPGHFTFDGHPFSGWIVHVINRGPASVFVTVWATCAGTTAKVVSPGTKG